MNGSGQEYRLAMSAKEFKSRVALTPCFFELESLKFLQPEDVALLRQVVRILDSAETETLLEGTGW